MLQKLSDRARASDINFRLLVPLLINQALVQTVISIVRITTSYRAVELQLPVVWLGVISATFALFPIFLALSVGRFIDRGYDAVTQWIGAGLLFLSAAGFALWSSPAALLIFTLILGVGHLCLMASLQMLCLRAAGPSKLEHVFGNYMVAGAIGQGLGPYIVGWLGGAATLPPIQVLFTIGVATSAVVVLIALTMRSGPAPAHLSDGSAKVPVGSLLRVKGLAAVILAGVFIVTAQDLVVIYLPLLGPERSIDVKDIGILLTVRAAASMVSRFLYTRILFAVGRDRLMVITTFVGALSFAALAAPLPLSAMFVTMACMGFSLGIATTLSVTTVVDRTPRAVHGTANSLRIIGNRLGQVSLPFGMSLVAAATGVGGILAIIALSLAGSAAAVQWTKPPKDGPA